MQSRQQELEPAPRAPGEGRPPAIGEGVYALQQELDRVRRFDRSFSVLVVRLDTDHPIEISRRDSLIARKEDARERESRIIASCGDKILFAHVGQVLQDGLRDMDLTCCDVTNRRYVVVLPECDGTDGARLVERLEKLVLRGTGLRVRTGIAEVRTDGLIIADLVQKASDRCASGTSEELAPKRFDEPMARESRLSA